MEKIKDFFKGNISKKTITHYLIPFGMGLFYFFLYIARLLFPYIESYPYHWTTSMISRLGRPDENPVGWIFFAVACIVLGVGSIPLISYKYRRFSKMKKPTAMVIAFFMIGVCVSLILLGAIPNFQTEDRIFMLIHGINAIILIGGGSLMVLISFILILKEHFTKGERESKFSGKLVLLYTVLAIYGIICITMISISLSQHANLGTQYVHDPATPLLLSGPFWEWQTMAVLLVLIAMPCYILPEKVD